MSLRKRYRHLLTSPGLLVMPGVYDALSARIAAAAGFEAIAAGGYAAVGSMLAGPDMGQSNMRDYADHYARICAAVEVPVTVDADTGFGDIHNIRQMVRAFEAAGVAGLMIGDQVFPNRCGYMPGKEIVPVEQMLAKLMAALDARTDPDLVIVARTDAAADHGFDAAIERCQLFVETGVDVAKPQGVDTPADIKRAIQEIPGPYLATISQAAGRPRVDLADLEELGAAAVSLPSIALFAAAHGVSEVLREVASSRSVANVGDRLLPLDDYYRFVRWNDEQQREEGYRAAARDLLERRPVRADSKSATYDPKGRNAQ